MVAYNIVFTGETESGISSLISLLVGRKGTGPVSTGEYQRRIVIEDAYVYRFWECPGFNAGSNGTTTSEPQAEDSLRSLFKELTAKDGVHLLVFCLRYNAATTKDFRAYESILSCALGTKIPVVAVVTHADEILQPEASNDRWTWSKFNAEWEQKGIKLLDYACISTLEDETVPKLSDQRNRAREKVWNLIKTQAKPLSLPNAQPKAINIILFGELGVGKSSVVNLIAGESVAEISADALGCTLSSKEHEFTVGPHLFRIWDTVGLNEPEIGATGFIPAIEKAYKLICDVTAAGGLHLLLFCVRGGRVTTTIQSNYRLFYEVLCEKQVPVALVITHMERERDMEDYWRRNKDTFTGLYDIRIAGHACVAALPDEPEKYAVSRAVIHELLTDCDGFGRYTMPPAIDTWMARFISCFHFFVRVGDRVPRGNRLTKMLIKRCGFTRDVADRVRKVVENSV